MAHLPKIPNPASWLRYVVEHPRQIIFAILLITLVFAWKIPNLRFQTSIYDLAIEDLPETIQYHSFKNEFGCEEIILVVARAEHIFEPKTFEQVERLAKELSGIKEVKRVISLPGIKRAMDITDKWSISDFKRIISPIKLLQRNLVSEDNKTTVLSLILEDVKEKDQVIDAVKKVIDNTNASLSLYQIGMPIVSKALGKFTGQDFFRLPPITFALIAIILFVFFRDLRGILIPAGSVLIALIWTFGLMAWTGTPLAMLTMIVPIFLIAVGTAYCMYIFPEYLESIKRSDSPKEASFRCFLQLGFPTTLAVITTVIGLCSLLVNKISAIREFAVFSCFGILCMLVIILTFLPAVMALLPFPKKKTGHEELKDGFLDRILSGIANLNLHHQKTALIFIAIVALAGIIGISRVRVETNPVGFFKEDTSISRHFHDIYRDMAGSFPINVVVDSKEDDYFEKPGHLKKIAELQIFLDSLGGVDKTVSFVDYLKLVNYATSRHNEEFYALPEEPFEIRMLVNSYKTMLGNDMLQRFMNADFSKLNILLRTHISSSVDILATQEKIEKHLRENFPETFSFQVTGFGVVISQSSKLLTEGQVKSLSLTLILVFGIMFLLFMSYKVGFIGMLPNCFPIIVNFGLMGWLGIPLSVATSLIASVAIGLAVDDTIHYLVRYNREFKKDLDKNRALKDTINRIGKPIIFTTLTVSIGFSILMFSSFRPTAVFGLMMVVTMFSALVADLILLPSLMLHVELVTVWDMLKLRLGKDPQKGIPLFDGLSRTQVHYILMAGALKQYKGGETLFRKGEVSDSMYAVISGELEVVKVIDESSTDNAHGAKQLISRLKAGDVVGEMGMIRSCERSATVISTTPSELLQINDKMVKRLHWLYPPTAQKFFFNLMTVLCDRLENLTDNFLGVTTLDTLTGLYSRSHFIDMLKKEIARSHRYKTPLSLLVMDLDNFKGINHLYGHHTGDAILAEVGSFLKKHARKTDVASRYDGQQFVIMLTHSMAETAQSVANRLRELIAKHCFRIGANPIYITASFGLVSMNIEMEKSHTEFLDDGINALKEAKKSGKNRVSEFQESLASPS
ncbi:MAG: MMPL family transporter [Deltaproteobacteria bacterium]|nr:MMPL family transporter [Deltaproteobacteria bacterium]